MPWWGRVFGMVAKAEETSSGKGGVILSGQNHIFHAVLPIYRRMVYIKSIILSGYGLPRRAWQASPRLLCKSPLGERVMF